MLRMAICLKVFILLFGRSDTLGAGSDSDEEPLVVDDEDRIQIRVAVQGRISSEEVDTTTTCCTGIKDEFRMEMLEDEKKKQNQYNHLLGNIMDVKMDVKNETMEK